MKGFWHWHRPEKGKKIKRILTLTQIRKSRRKNLKTFWQWHSSKKIEKKNEKYSDNDTASKNLNKMKGDHDTDTDAEKANKKVKLK